MSRLRARTWLAPSIPEPVFTRIASVLAEALEWELEASQDPSSSGPAPGPDNPFVLDQVDLGWVCGSAWIWLSDDPQRRVHRLGPGPKVLQPWGDPAAKGWSELVVRREPPIRGLADLKGKVWASNDPISHSGHWSMRRGLERMGLDTSFFGEVRFSGSHLASLAMVAAGEADGCALDSVVRTFMAAEGVHLPPSLRVVDTWGPFPVQPLVISERLLAHRPLLERTLMALHEDPVHGPAMERLGVFGFERVSEARFASMRLDLPPAETFSVG